MQGDLFRPTGSCCCAGCVCWMQQHLQRVLHRVCVMLALVRGRGRGRGGYDSNGLADGEDGQEHAPGEGGH